MSRTPERFGNASIISIPKALETIAWTWADALRVRGETASVLWREQIAPRIQAFWPLREAVRSPTLNMQLARMLLQTREAFPEAVDMLTVERPVLGGVDEMHLIIHDLGPFSAEQESANSYDEADRFPYVERFPLDVLRMLVFVVVPGTTEPPGQRPS